MSDKTYVVEIHDHEGEDEQSWTYGPYTKRQANARLKRIEVKHRKENRAWARENKTKFLDRYPLTAHVHRLRTLEEAGEL